jgi:excisionase family DNA binding protein
MEPQILLSTGQAARKLGVGKTKLLALVRTGLLPSTMFDSRIRVRVADMDAFIDALPKGYIPGKAVQRPSEVERLEDSDAIGGDGTGGRKAVRHG